MTESQEPRIDPPISTDPLPHKLMKDLRGKRFGKLFVFAYSHNRMRANGVNDVYWKCQCDCGEVTALSRRNLLCDGTQSCGCKSTAGKKGVDKFRENEQKRSHMLARVKAGLPPMPPTIVEGDPAVAFAHDSLLAYACLQWGGYQPATHHRLIAQYLERVERGEIKRLMITIPPRHGKQCAHSTPVFTAAGWKTHGELKVGDRVYTPSGCQTKVIAESTEHHQNDYLVDVSTGEEIRCHANHEWTVYDRLFGKWVTEETESLSHQIEGLKGVEKLDNRYVLPTLCSDFQFSIDFPFDDFRYIVSVTYSPNEELGKCIQVDSEDGLYLVGKSFIPTHNSMLVSEYFPAWYLGRNPDNRFICTSYGQELASDFGRKVRNQIADPLFQEIFPDSKLAEDSAAVDKFNMAYPKTGGYFAVGVGGALTGRGAHCVSGDTMVTTDRGVFRIDYLATRYSEFNVLSYSVENDVLEFKPILATRKSFTKELVLIKTCNGKSVWATPNHLFYMKDIKGYEPSILLQSGNELLTDRMEYDTVVNTLTVNVDDIDVYDIQVQDNHNFFANGILVHNCLIIDDPIRSREDADSESNRRKIKDWYTAVAYTRLMDQGSIIICQTRWHTSDLSGWLLKEHKHENWIVLNMPAINEKGEALWPEKFPLSVLESIRRTLPARDWQALYQQQPFTEEGEIFKRGWWKKWPDGKALPECSYVIQSWDTAFTERDVKQNSFSARTTWGVFKRVDDDYANVILLEAWKGQVDYSDLRKEAMKAYKEYEPDKVIIEKKASGISLIQDLRRSGLPVHAFNPEKDKVARAYRAQSLFENGRVFYPDRRWADEVIDELCMFRPGNYNDTTDTVSQAFIWLTNSWLVRNSADVDSDDDDDDLPENVTRIKRKAAYG